MVSRLEVGYYKDGDVQTKLAAILAELSVDSNNLVVTGYDSEGGDDHYILVEILEPMVSRLVDAEADITDIQTALTSVLTAIAAIQAVVEAHETRIAALEA